MDISSIRTDYAKMALDEGMVDKNPVNQFKKWFQDAVNGHVHEPNAMHLATIGERQRPTGRIVLLKSFDTNGFVFYTNYNSKKATELAQNSFGAITFFWPELERQIRIEGKIEKYTITEAEKYFAERPRLSQIGAWASPQSEKIENRAYLEENFKTYEKKFEGEDIPKPTHWGGYILKPDYFEFWQGRRSRLHDRVVYSAVEGAIWEIFRIAP